MGTALEKEWKRLLQKEERMLFSAENKKETKLDAKIRGITGMIEEKIPEKLKDTLDVAFYKAFFLIFETHDSGSKTILVRYWQPANAASPIVSTVLAMCSSSN